MTHRFDEAELKYGALFCNECKKTFYYRTHILPGEAEYEVPRCPYCGHELHEVLTDTFIDGTEETLQVLQQLDEESREGGMRSMASRQPIEVWST